MVIHVVKDGETVQSIADSYGITAERLILENEIDRPNRLATGETLVVQIPDITHIVEQGDTLGSIADKYGVPVSQLLRNNTYISDREYIYPGETIVISFQGIKTGAISTNGYVYPFVDMSVLRKTLPFLTYLTIFSYEVTAEGDIKDVDDADVIQTAWEYGVAPVMMLVAAGQNQEEKASVIRSILTNQQIQDRLLSNLIRLLNDKKFYGVTIDTPFISPNDRGLYDDFVLLYSSRVTEEGYKAFVTFSIRVFELLTGTIFTGLNYPVLGMEAEGITLITYEFGYVQGIPPGTLSMDTFRRFLSAVLKLIPPEKTDIGITDTGYVWKLPYEPGVSKGMAVSYDAAIQIAINYNVPIQYDATTNSAYFEYSNSEEYVVRFWDARSVDAFADLVPEFGLNGLGVWNIMIFFPQLWQVLNARFDIRKILL